jgi:hypothetical protein
MALGADIGVNLRLGRSGLICVPARATNGCRGVNGMDVGFHFGSVVTAGIALKYNGLLPLEEPCGSNRQCPQSLVTIENFFRPGGALNDKSGPLSRRTRNRGLQACGSGLSAGRAYDRTPSASLSPVCLGRPTNRE